MKRMCYGEKVEKFLKIEAEELKRIGIQPVSKPMALNFLLEKYNAGEIFKRLESKRKRNSKFKLVINLKGK